MSVSAAQALERLRQGNRRFVAGAPQHPHGDPGWRKRLEKGQRPFAAILACADSRTPPELVFDQGLGDLFVCRVAGNVATPGIVGSIEYAVAQLDVKLCLVMGHMGCGAVEAALSGKAPRGDIRTLAEAIQPVVEAVRSEPGDLHDNAIRWNAVSVAAQLRAEEPILADAVREQGVRIESGYYDLSTGVVEIYERS